MRNPYGKIKKNLHAGWLQKTDAVFFLPNRKGQFKLHKNPSPLFLYSAVGQA